MRKQITITGILAALLLAAAASAQTSGDRNTLMIVFNDGRQQTIPMANARIDFKGPSMIVSSGGRSQSFPVADISHMEFNSLASSIVGRGRFLGKWRVGDGQGRDFYITLDRDGQARKSQGASHGTWAVVDGEARIRWDDGWHDAIRKAGSKFEKVAFEPGKTFEDTPSNITDAENVDPQPI